MSQIQVIFGRRVKKLRQMMDITQEELAERAGISISYIGGIERGAKCPTIDTVEKLAQALELTISELMSFDSRKVDSDDKSIEMEKLLTEYADKIERLYRK